MSMEKTRRHEHSISCLENRKGSLVCKVTGEGAPEPMARVKRDPTMPYMEIGRLVAAYVMKCRHPFTSFDINIPPEIWRFFTSYQHVVPRSYVQEFLHAFADPAPTKRALGPIQLVQANPKLTERTKKYWKGY